MPDIILFAASQKVIVDIEERTTSLITLLEKIGVQVPESGAWPPDAAIPSDWRILTLWKKLPGEQGRRFQQKVELIQPNSLMFLNALSDFAFEPEHLNFRVLVKVNLFPIGAEGTYWLKLYVRETGLEQEQAWQEKGAYPIEVGHVRS